MITVHRPVSEGPRTADPGRVWPQSFRLLACPTSAARQLQLENSSEENRIQTPARLRWTPPPLSQAGFFFGASGSRVRFRLMQTQTYRLALTFPESAPGICFFRQIFS